MALKDKLPQTLSQEAARGMAIAFGVVTVGVWGMLGYGWYLGPTHHLQRTAIAHVPPPALVPPTQPKAPVAQVAATTPLVADPTQRLDAAPAPEPVNVTPIKRLPQSHSLLVTDPKAGAPAVQAAAPDANDKQVAPEAGLEEAGDFPAASSEPGMRLTTDQQAGLAPVKAPVNKPEVAKPMVAAKPVVATKPAPAQVVAAKPAPVQVATFEAPAEAGPSFPVAAPVVHPRYTSVYNRRLHRRRWVLAAKPTASLLAREERPAHDLTAAAPFDPGTRVLLAAETQVAAAPQAKQPELSPGAQAEMAATQREEQPTRGVPDNSAPAGIDAAMPLARSPQALAARVAAGKPRQRLALHRQQLPLSARMAQRPQQLARPAAHPLAQPVAQAAVKPAAPTGGVPLYRVSTPGDPVYDAANHTLRVPLEGRLQDGPLKVYRLDNGRAYVDVAGARPSASARTKAVATQDGVFQKGAIATHADTGVTRMSFDLGRNGDLAARVEGGQVVLRAVKKSKQELKR